MKKDLTAEKYLQRVLTSEARDDCPVRRTLLPVFLELARWGETFLEEDGEDRPQSEE